MGAKKSEKRKWKKSSPELVETFQAAVPDGPGVERRQMFGYPCAFVNGNMFTGLHEERLIVRLPEDRRAELLAVDGASVFEPMKGRPMRQYVVVPPMILGDAKALRAWMRRARDYAASLPAKAKKSAKPPKKRT